MVPDGPPLVFFEKGSAAISRRFPCVVGGTKIDHDDAELAPDGEGQRRRLEEPWTTAVAMAAPHRPNCGISTMLSPMLSASVSA